MPLLQGLAHRDRCQVGQHVASRAQKYLELRDFALLEPMEKSLSPLRIAQVGFPAQVAQRNPQVVRAKLLGNRGKHFKDRKVKIPDFLVEVSVAKRVSVCTRLYLVGDFHQRGKQGGKLSQLRDPHPLALLRTQVRDHRQLSRRVEVPGIRRQEPGPVEQLRHHPPELEGNAKRRPGKLRDLNRINSH